MYKWDKEISKTVHLAGRRHMKLWAFISEWGLWAFFPYMAWVWFTRSSGEDFLSIFQPLLWSIFISFFGVLALRRIIQRPRPTEIKTEYKAIFKWSFPSLHASVGFSAATSLAILAMNMGDSFASTWLLAVGLLIFAFIVTITRLFVGVHYFSDLLVGGVVGILISVIIELL